MIEPSLISVSGKQTKVGKSLTEYVQATLIQTLKKYFESFINANVLFSKDTFNFRCEISIHVEGSIFIQGNALSNDAYGAFNIANEKIKKRLRRYHRKLTDHRLKNKKPLKYLKANQYVIQDPEIKNSKKNIYEPVIIAESEDFRWKLTRPNSILIYQYRQRANCETYQCALTNQNSIDKLST